MNLNTINGETLHFDILKDAANFWLVTLFSVSQDSATSGELEKSIRYLINSTPSMRFRYGNVGGSWKKEITDFCSEIDIPTYDRADFDTVVETEVAKASISDAPLSRFAFIWNGDQYFLLCLLNHMTMDAISTAYFRSFVANFERYALQSEDESAFVANDKKYFEYYQTIQAISQKAEPEHFRYWLDFDRTRDVLIGKKNVKGRYCAGAPIKFFNNHDFFIANDQVNKISSKFTALIDHSLISAVSTHILMSLAKIYGDSVYPFWLVESGRPRDSRFSADQSRTCGELAYPVPVYPSIVSGRSFEQNFEEVHSHIRQVKSKSLDFASVYWNDNGSDLFSSLLNGVEQPIIQINYRGSAFEKISSKKITEVSNKIVFDDESYRVYDLCFNIHRESGALVGEIVANSKRFPEEVIGKMLENLRTKVW